MATFLEKSDTFTDWMEKINKFHEEIQNGFGIPSQENKYDTTNGKYLQVGAFGLGKIETTTTDTLDVVGTRFDFVSADATSNFSLPKNFLGGSLVTIVNNGQGFQIIQNDDDLNFRTVYNDIYEEWVSFKNILDNVQFGLTKKSIKQEDYLVGVPSADLVPMVIDGGTLTDAMNAQAQALLNQIENLKLTTVPVTKETLVTNGNLTAIIGGSIDVPKANNCGSISDTMNAQAQALLNQIKKTNIETIYNITAFNLNPSESKFFSFVMNGVDFGDILASSYYSYMQDVDIIAKVSSVNNITIKFRNNGNNIISVPNKNIKIKVL